MNTSCSKRTCTLYSLDKEGPTYVWRDAGWGAKSRWDVEYEKYISKAVYEMKRSRRDRDAFISTGGMRDSFEIDSGMRDLNRK